MSLFLLILNNLALSLLSPTFVSEIPTWSTLLCIMIYVARSNWSYLRPGKKHHKYVGKNFKEEGRQLSLK